MFRGSFPAKIDDKGRLKMPSAFGHLLEQRWGPELFVTSVTGASALVYPLSVWEEREQKLMLAPSSDRATAKYLERVNYFGQQLTLDNQGRVVIPQILREKAQVVGEVMVVGRLDNLEIWNRERLDRRLEDEPFTDEDFQGLALLGI